MPKGTSLLQEPDLTKLKLKAAGDALPWAYACEPGGGKRLTAS
jgi:hypothetical protein